jgi:Flp pilus assembly protein TadG
VSDSGSIVVGWLAKLVVFFSLLGFLAFDGFTVIVATFDASDDAATAARAAADAFQSSKSVQGAYDAAVTALDGKPDVVETKTFSVAQDGTVTLTVDRHPRTLWMERLGVTRGMTHVSQSGTGKPGG